MSYFRHCYQHHSPNLSLKKKKKEEKEVSPPTKKKKKKVRTLVPVPAVTVRSKPVRAILKLTKPISTK